MVRRTTLYWEEEHVTYVTCVALYNLSGVAGVALISIYFNFFFMFYSVNSNSKPKIILMVSKVDMIERKRVELLLAAEMVKLNRCYIWCCGFTGSFIRMLLRVEINLLF